MASKHSFISRNFIDCAPSEKTFGLEYTRDLAICLSKRDTFFNKSVDIRRTNQIVT